MVTATRRVALTAALALALPAGLIADTLISERNSPSNPNRPMANRPAAALIGKVGPGDDLFFIGDDAGPIRVRNSGRLYLGVNDDYLADNRGTFRVIVRY